MNWLDIVIILLLISAVWEGWKRGVITQVLGLVAVVAGIFLAWKYGTSIGVWLGLEGTAAAVAGFVAVLIAAIVVVVLIGRFTRGLFRIVGLGVFDNLLGVVFSMLKMVVFVGLVMLVIKVADPRDKVIPERIRDNSVMYGVVERINGAVFPFVRDMFR